MTARTWAFGDPEPADHPPVVDDNGHTWTWSADDESGYGWTRQVMTRHKLHATYGPEGQEWEDIAACNASLREATADEADNVTVIFAKGHPMEGLRARMAELTNDLNGIRRTAQRLLPDEIVRQVEAAACTLGEALADTDLYLENPDA